MAGSADFFLLFLISFVPIPLKLAKLNDYRGKDKIITCFRMKAKRASCPSVLASPVGVKPFSQRDIAWLSYFASFVCFFV